MTFGTVPEERIIKGTSGDMMGSSDLVLFWLISLMIFSADQSFMVDPRSPLSMLFAVSLKGL